MSNFINLLDIVFPVSSIYLSVDNTSPADIIGGTWEKIEYGMLACAGDSSNAAAGVTGGSKTISVSQMPSHTHTVDEAGKDILYNRLSPNNEIPYTNGGSGRISHGYFITSAVGGGQEYIPAHYSVNIWRRAA